MRFIVDEQLSPRVAEWLKSKGYEAEHIRTVEGLQTADKRIAELARRRGAVIVSKDADFLTIIDPDLQLLLVKVGNTQNRILIARLEAEWDRIEVELGMGKAVVELN
ncbi:MAG TPA: DUF5615 family PIN-like protein [Hyphomonadaceae bacterium]|jgi:predicted nuclease of predicted toxin-antitoxin system|nr:DUF5615 family PIN-like protein [Hyphomonadaceae bacterium]